MSKIIVEWGKHGEAFWPASTDEDWAKSSLAILSRRFTEGYWYSEDDEYYPEIEQAVDSKDQGFITYRSGRKEPNAWRLLDIFSDHQYQRVTIEHLQEV